MSLRYSIYHALLAGMALAALVAPAAAEVSFKGVPSSAANGDYNGDGVVDAADYTFWRDRLGSATPLPNDNGLGTPIGQAHYDLWKTGFGSTGGSGSSFAFEDAANWNPRTYTTAPTVGPETAPPGPDSIWFAAGVGQDATLVSTDERTGENGSLKMGTFAFGGESNSVDTNEKFTWVLNNSVTLTAKERNTTTGEVANDPGTRAARIGRDNFNPLGTTSGGTTETAAWGILLQKSGSLKYDTDVPAGSSNLDFSRDKSDSAGALYEISGSAELNLAGRVRIGDRDSGGGVRTTPGAIFRVRGSGATVNVDDFHIDSRLGLWDHDNDVDSDNPNGVTQINLGKFVTEFVLDANGASSIVVADNLQLGASEDIDGNREFGYAFLRIKLSEPTTAGSGVVGSGDEIVLFQADRLSSGIDADNDPQNTVEIEEGRFFDPDRAGPNSSGTTTLPHGGLWDGGTVRTDYAGAQYQWTINYFDSSDDAVVIDAVTLSNLNIVGTPGDLSGNGSLGVEDRNLLLGAIAAPPSIAIATAQNLFDLNADEVVDSLDLTLFDTYFPLGGAFAASQVPEPSSAALLCLAGLLWGARRRV
ncbi:hypothetical protein Pla175_31740 [Pirellulimonas nuda]|uniref:PEP-CTERM protein-sorting domain-containing protein n=1 Tax=Pirellulimonas nuda TaxID=2528009 RepID=A0A518DE80_9BACT|nr:PEP-CTERM sorting domain-containing protein [Pirellulimonas nuda]QDU89779.1 hypothetical protein Pla175_31740 [Pirellulimonas nuda]